MQQDLMQVERDLQKSLKYNFELVATGEYKNSTTDVVEIKFNPTEFKKIKFVFKKANRDWASASEFVFYKEDKVSETVNNIFTDGTMTI